MSEYSYRLIRENRKTVSLRVDEDGELTVKAPFYAAKGFIDDFVDANAAKLLADYMAGQADRERKREFLSKPPEKLPYHGKELPVILSEDAFYLRFGNDRFYCPMRPLSELIPSLEQLYKKLARSMIPELLDVAEMMGRSPSDIRINSARGRWGSCSSKGSINLSWRLVLADERTRRYVMIHELSHLTYLDHSRDFWDLVGKHEPDYKLFRERLNTVSRTLEKYGLD
ncbi:MAG: M48 family metallopeptidase [Oscillospiraceae bacterium]|nr:M48 family metallopeptidase [Oscillospiraceae bacterium]